MNPLGLIYDTETTGIPDWHSPSDSEHQPHIVQLAARLVDLETRRTVQMIDLIIRPAGWEIPQEVVDIHGITAEQAYEIGVPERVALDALFPLWQSAEVRIGHSEAFDARILRIALKRYYGDDLADAWKAGNAACTGRLGQKAMQTGRRMPKLTEAYEHYLGEEYEGAHSALADVDACMAVYFAMTDEQEKEPATA